MHLRLYFHEGKKKILHKFYKVTALGEEAEFLVKKKIVWKRKK